MNLILQAIKSLFRKLELALNALMNQYDSLAQRIDSIEAIEIPECNIQTVNGIEPDENGNILIEIPECNVQTVNGIAPDENGNVEIEIPEPTPEIEVDTTLTQSGMAADAMSVGNAIRQKTTIQLTTWEVGD